MQRAYQGERAVACGGWAMSLCQCGLFLCAVQVTKVDLHATCSIAVSSGMMTQGTVYQQIYEKFITLKAVWL